jgi:hypothetical protein
MTGDKAMPSRHDTIVPLIHVAVPSYLRDMLRADEGVLAALRGTAHPRRRGASATAVTLVLTTERVLFGNSGLFRHSVHELAYKRISTVSYQRGLLSASLTIHAKELALDVRLRNKSEWSTIDRIVSGVKDGIVFSPVAQASGPASPLSGSSTRSWGIYAGGTRPPCF